MIPPPPRSTLFPYTTLFRSQGKPHPEPYLKGAELLRVPARECVVFEDADRKSTRLNSSHVEISYAVFCLKKKKKIRKQNLHLNRSPQRTYLPALILRIMKCA